jgi:hypothetical protein
MRDASGLTRAGGGWRLWFPCGLEVRVFSAESGGCGPRSYGCGGEVLQLSPAIRSGLTGSTFPKPMPDF